MVEGCTNEIRVYVNDTIYTTLKQKAEKLGITISQLVRSFIIKELEKRY